MDSVERRTDKLIVRDVEGETVVYNTATEMVTVLDAETAAVWKAADGEAPIEAIAQALELPEEKVEVALVRLGDAGLLKTPMSRRTLLRGAGTVVAAGGLMTIMAPPAFAASSSPRVISGSGSCGKGQKDAVVTVTGDGFAAGTVNYTITYAVPGATGATSSVTGTLTQVATGTATGAPITLNGVKPGTTTASISATDSAGNTIVGQVSISGCGNG
jgi:hypothetical protein